MKQFKLIAQHYDMAPGTIVYKLGISQPETKQRSEVHYLVTLIEDYRGEGDLRVIPANKVEEVNALGVNG